MPAGALAPHRLPAEEESRLLRRASRFQLRLEVGARVVRLIGAIGPRELRAPEFPPTRLLFTPTEELGKVQHLALTRFGKRGHHLTESLLHGHGLPLRSAVLLMFPLRLF